MSHFSRIQTQITDKRFLLLALSDLGFHFEEGALKIAGFRGREIGVEIAIHLPNSNGIGLCLVNGTYEVVADWAGVAGLNQTEFIHRLTQRYAYHAAKEKMAEQGFALVEEKVETSGQIRLLLRRIAS